MRDWSSSWSRGRADTCPFQDDGIYTLERGIAYVTRLIPPAKHTQDESFGVTNTWTLSASSRMKVCGLHVGILDLGVILAPQLYPAPTGLLLFLLTPTT